MVEAMSAEAAKAKRATGDGMGKGVFYGPINNKMQVPTLSRARRTVRKS